MRKGSVWPVWALIAVLLIHLSGGLLGITPTAWRAGHAGTMSSDAATNQIPTDLRIDRETASLARNDVFAPPAFLLGQVSNPSGHRYPGKTPESESIHHTPLDILQLQHVLRI